VTIIGRRPSPRALLIGWTDSAVDVLSGLFATSRSIESIDEVDSADWDVVIAGSGVDPTLPSHLFVLAFGGPLPPPTHRSPENIGQVDFARKLMSTEFILPDDLPPGASDLVRELIPRLGDPPYFGLIETTAMGWRGNVTPQSVKHLLTSSSGHALAGIFTRHRSKAEVWAIPHAWTDLRWIDLAVARWRGLDAERFPSNPDWRHDPQWSTSAESSIAARIQRLRLRREEVVAELEADERRSIQEFERLLADGDARERMLLTAQGEPLVAAVAACLEELGFNVQPSDEILSGQPKREDLRVSLPSKLWTALVEVKGYKEGAKINDLMKFIRYAELFLKDSGRTADAKWYVVNQFRNDDPATRAAPLRGADMDAEAFGDGGGLIIDTRDLLRLWLAVEAGTVSPEEARTSLVTSRGRFELEGATAAEAAGPTAATRSDP
jgi:hypothetical protein